MTEKRMRLAVIDGTNVVMRCVSVMGEAFEPARVIASAEGLMRKFVEQTKATHAIVAFDGDRCWRYDAFPAYKANRTTNTRAWQNTAQAQLMAKGYRCVIEPRYEADDLVATLSARAAAAEQEAVVLSGDSDLAALVWPPDVRVWRFGYGAKKESQFVEHTLESLAEKYGIRWAAQLVTYKALVGEPGDGVPGAPGIGPVRAHKLLALHDSLDDMLAAGAIKDSQHIIAKDAYALIKPDADVPLDVITSRECALPKAGK